MWPILVEFRSASSEIKRRKKKEESVVKHKSADNYVERPNYGSGCYVDPLCNHRTVGLIRPVLPKSVFKKC